MIYADNFLCLSFENFDCRYNKPVLDFSVDFAQKKSGTIETFLEFLKRPKSKKNINLDFNVSVDLSPDVCRYWYTGHENEVTRNGPDKYDLRTVGFWFSDDQKNDIATTGFQIYEQLKMDMALPNCLGIHDLVAIRDKGFDVFCQLFSGTNPVGFGTIVTVGHSENLFVPYLIGGCRKVIIGWENLETLLSKKHPVLLFP